MDRKWIGSGPTVGKSTIIFGCEPFGAPQFDLDLNQKGIWISDADGCSNNSVLSTETIRDPEPEA